MGSTGANDSKAEKAAKAAIGPKVDAEKDCNGDVPAGVSSFDEGFPVVARLAWWISGSVETTK